MKNHLLPILAFLISVMVVSCGGEGGGGGGTASSGTPAYTVGVTLSGLSGQVTLLNNGADPLTLTANGSFTFATPIGYNGSYSVTVGTQPTGTTCSIANNSGSGTNVIGNINNVSVMCAATTYSISGTVTGLVGQITLLNNLSDAKTITANGIFTFQTPIASGGSHSVTVGTQPDGQVCWIDSGDGIHVMAHVSTVSVNCATATGGTFPVQNAMKVYWGSGTNVTFSNITGYEQVKNDSYTISGTVSFRYGAPSSTTFNGASAFQVIETTTGSLDITGTTKSPPQQGILNFYLDSQYSPIGFVSAGVYCVASTKGGYPLAAVVGQGGLIGIFSCYSDSTKSILLGTTSLSYLASAGRSGGLYFEVVKNDYDTASNLLQTSKQRYNIPGSGTPSLEKTSINYTVNSGSPSTTPVTVTINFL